MNYSKSSGLPMRRLLPSILKLHASGRTVIVSIYSFNDQLRHRACRVHIGATMLFARTSTAPVQLWLHMCDRVLGL